MAKRRAVPTTATTLPFDRFWSWIQVHPNCIVRAGTPDAVLFDDEDYHWHFAVEDAETYLVQVIRGKRLVGELVINPSEVAFVQGEPADNDEFLFEAVAENDGGRYGLVHFVLSHDFDEEETATPGRFVH